MMNDKRIKAEELLREIGNIDDALLADAMAYRSRGGYFRRVVLIAAAISLTVILLMSTLIISQIAMSDKEESVTEYEQNDSIDSGNTGTEDIIYLSSMDNMLTYGIDKSNYIRLTAPDSLPYFSEYAHVVWKYADDDGYYVSRDIKKGEFERILASVGKGNSIGDSSPELNCSVWILLGDGRVISPYLASSNGNIYPEIFDYNAEIYPEKALIEKIFNLLTS